MFVDVSVACELVSCPAEETARCLSVFISDDKATLQYMSMLKSICWKVVTQVHVNIEFPMRWVEYDFHP